MERGGERGDLQCVWAPNAEHKCAVLVSQVRPWRTRKCREEREKGTASNRSSEGALSARRSRSRARLPSQRGGRKPATACGHGPHKEEAQNARKVEEVTWSACEFQTKAQIWEDCNGRANDGKVKSPSRLDRHI